MGEAATSQLDGAIRQFDKSAPAITAGPRTAARVVADGLSARDSVVVFPVDGLKNRDAVRVATP